MNERVVGLQWASVVATTPGLFAGIDVLFTATWVPWLIWLVAGLGGFLWATVVLIPLNQDGRASIGLPSIILHAAYGLFVIGVVGVSTSMRITSTPGTLLPLSVIALLALAMCVISLAHDKRSTPSVGASTAWQEISGIAVGVPIISACAISFVVVLDALGYLPPLAVVPMIAAWVTYSLIARYLGRGGGSCLDLRTPLVGAFSLGLFIYALFPELLGLLSEDGTDASMRRGFLRSFIALGALAAPLAVVAWIAEHNSQRRTQFD